jgi:hypothetical protein
MTTLTDLANDFQRLATSLTPRIQSELEVEARSLRDIFAKDTPVRTGRLQHSWRIRKTRRSGTIASVTILNPISYGSVIEFGLDEQQYPHHPWVVSFAKEKQKSKKIVRKDGKIWSKYAVGGITSKTLTNSYIQNLTRKIGDSVLKGF